MALSKLKKSLIYQSLYEILIILLPLLTTPYISRVLGAKNIGIHSYTYSIANYFVLFANLGIKNHGSRSIAKVRDNPKKLNRVFSEILALHLFFSTIVAVVYMLFLPIITGRYYEIAWIQGIYILAAVFDINWFFFGMEEFRLTVGRNTIVKVISVVCIFLFVKSKADLWVYALILALGTFIGQSLVWFMLSRFVSWKKPQWSGLKRHLKPLFVLFLPVLALSLYKYMDKIMLGSISSKIQVGFFENAEKVINIPMSLITAFGTVLMSRIANMISNSQEKKIIKLINSSMEAIMLIALAIAFGLASIATILAPIFFGKEFIECGVLIMGLAVTVPFMAFANVIRTQYLIPYNMDKVYIISLLSGAIINLLINILLIPRFAARGSVIATIAAEAAVCIYQTIAVRKFLPVKKYLLQSLPFAILGGTMFFIVFRTGKFLGTSIKTLIIQVVVGVVIYSIGALFILIKTKSPLIKRIKSLVAEHFN